MLLLLLVLVGAGDGASQCCGRDEVALSAGAAGWQAWAWLGLAAAQRPCRDHGQGCTCPSALLWSPTLLLRPQTTSTCVQDAMVQQSVRRTGEAAGGTPNKTMWQVRSAVQPGRRCGTINVH